MSNISIALDGPAGAGKSTIAKMIAKKKKFTYIDTGAMYRAVTFKTIQLEINKNNLSHIKELLDDTNIEMLGDRIYLDGLDISKEIRSLEVTKQVSDIAKIPIVRDKMIEMQRQMALKKDIVMDGRDIGTNVLPKATFKFFLTASLEERAKRRYEEMVKKGYEISLEEIKLEIKNRDKMDSEREIDPLQMAEDAILIDTTNKDIDRVTNEILKYIE